MVAMAILTDWLKTAYTAAMRSVMGDVCGKRI